MLIGGMRAVVLGGLLRLRYELDRRLRPDDVVTRTVQGVDMRMPRTHRLADYSRIFPRYGQNLVDVARAVAMTQTPLQVMDVGANIGDSALQMRSAVSAAVLCVEGDDYWLPFLEANCGRASDLEVEPSLLATGREGSVLSARRAAGTTSFVPGPPGSAAAARRTVTVEELLRRHPRFDDIRLVKVDTDGHDPRLVPPIAEALSHSHPVVFFEFDPELARDVGDDKPHDVWTALSEVGYRWVVVWDNTGREVGVVVLEGAERAWSHGGPSHTRGYRYWDVAVVHEEEFSMVRTITGLEEPPSSDDLVSFPRRRRA